MEKSGIKPIIQSIFSDLENIKLVNPKSFNSTFNRGENVKFIQAEFLFKDRPYSLFIYMPIENGGNYSNKIIIIQREYSNLGYEFVLNQLDYPKTTSGLSKIAKLKLESYYKENP